MRRASVERIIEALNSSGARCLVAGGLAVVAHGHLRFTADVDLVLDLEEENLRRALQALERLGYKPRAPVPLADFACRDLRESWVRDKGMKVFSLYSDQHPATEVDLFAEVPFDFERAWVNSVTIQLRPGLAARFVGLDDLLAMKRSAGRPRDLDDCQHLELLRPGRRP